MEEHRNLFCCVRYKMALDFIIEGGISREIKQLDRVLQMYVKLDVYFRHIIILIHVCTPDNCTWKQLIGHIFICFYLCRHSGEIGRTLYERVPSSCPTCTNTNRTSGPACC